MSGDKSWEEVQQEIGMESIKWTALADLKSGKYWKTWTRKYKKEKPKAWKVHKSQRVKYGYSVYDWWNFDSYIAGVIAHACERFAKDGAGYPPDMTAQEWKDFCLSIARPLSLWASDNRWKINGADTVELYEQVKEALHLFADNFGSFWD